MAPTIEDERLSDILQQYADGEISAADAAYEIQQLALPAFENPSASEVIIWAKEAGYGIPTPSEDEVQSQVERILARLHRKDTVH